MAGKAAVIALAALATSSCGRAAGATANDTGGLLAALGRAKPGEVITLAPGSYTNVGSATITSADPSHPAVLTDLTIADSSGLTLKNLELSAANTPIGQFGAEATIPFEVTRSKNVTLVALKVHGALDGTLATDVSGLIIRNSDQVTLADSDFSHLHNALNQFSNTNLTVRGNHFHGLRDDGVRGGGSSHVLIENNRCEDNHPDPSDDDHPDCIQFWTSGMTAVAHDITIRNNTYIRGKGRPTQGVFMRDETNHLPYEGVKIYGNVIEGAGYNGITVFGAINPDIEDNYVCPYHDQQSWLIVRQVKRAMLADNRASRYVLQDSSGVIQKNNKLIGECPEGGEKKDAGAP